jgi:hypothetical protein
VGHREPLLSSGLLGFMPRMACCNGKWAEIGAMLNVHESGRWPTVIGASAQQGFRDLAPPAYELLRRCKPAVPIAAPVHESSTSSLQ